MKIKFLFYVSKLYSLPVVQPLVAEASDRGIEFALFVSSKVQREISRILPECTVFTCLEDAIAFRADFVLCPGNFVDFRLPGLKVELFHGIGIEKPSHYRIRHFFDFYLTSGPLVTERFKKMEKKYGYFRTVETGWPKIDHILKYDTRHIREKFGVPSEKKVVLYAPTHSSSMESACDLLPVMDSAVMPGELWLCKPHEFMNRELLQSLRERNVQVIDDFDITPYLHLADVMISDTSSVIYEFMALDKPVVTFRTAGREDKGINIQSPGELRAALDRSLEYPAEFSDNRQRHLLEVNPVLDGSIARRIFDSLLSVDLSAPVGKKRKPLNLFRKIQIMYHSRFRKGYLR